MKKIINLLLGVILFIPIFVFADMGSPIIYEYEVIVNKSSGVYAYINDDNKYVKTDKIIPYGTKTEVSDFESEEDGYVSIDYDEETDTTYYVKLSDTELVDKNYKIDMSKLSSKEKGIVLKDTVIRKGPANAYESIGTIAAGTKLDIRFFVSIDEDTGDTSYETDIPFVYVEYNGKKGFITTYNSAVAYFEFTDGIISFKDVDIEDPVTNKKIGVLKANELLTKNVYQLDMWSSSYYVEYNGKKGLVNKFSFIIKSDKKQEFTTNKKFNIYNSLEVDMERYEKKLKVVGTVDKNTVIKSDLWDNMYDECRIYYEKGNVKGWIFAPNLESDNEGEGNTPCYGLTYETEIPEEDEGIIGSDDNKDDIEKPYEEKPNDVEEIPIQENNKENKTQIIYLCIGAALIISLTAVVIIVLINRKKKEVK